MIAFIDPLTLGALATLGALTTRLLGMKLLLGYHLWQLSFAVLAVGAVLAARYGGKPTEQPSP